MRQKHAGATRTAAVGRGLVFFAGVVESIGIQFARRHNTRYGPRHASELLALMSAASVCAEAACNFLRTLRGGKFPTADWFLPKVKGIAPEDMLSRAQGALRESVVRARDAGMIDRRPVIAIDKTMFPRYSRTHDMKWLVKYLVRGTDTAEGYITAKLIGCAAALHVACLQVTRDCFNPDLIRRMAAELRLCGIWPRLALLDREFFSVGVMRALDDAGIKFLMPAVRNSRVREAVREHIEGRRAAVSRFSISASDGGGSFEFTLVILRTKKEIVGAEDMVDGYAVFATSRSVRRATPEWAAAQYSRRWGIENGYKSTKPIKPSTTSTDPSLRLFLFFTALLVYNQWAMTRAASGARVPLQMFVMLEFVWAAMVEGLEPWRPWDPGGP